MATKKVSKGLCSCRKLLFVFFMGLFATRLLPGENKELGSFLFQDSTSDIVVLDASQLNISLPQDVQVAYAVSITYCHPDDFIADAAGILKHSIHMVSKKSRYQYQMYAFVHPQAQNCTQSLKQLGYDVMIQETPVRLEDIRNEELKRDASTSGCCQEKEFLKLYALTLTQHKIVVHLDLDCVLLKPLDLLFDAMLLPDSQEYYPYTLENPTAVTTKHPPIRKYIPDAMYTPYKKIPITAYFTRDYNMVKQLHTTPPNRINVQGGFWIVQPHSKVFDELVEIIQDGHEYTSAAGWGPDHLHPSAYYGVAQIQGLLSYYYGHVRPGSSVELNKCAYNNMVDQPRAECTEGMEVSNGQCLDCRTTPMDQIRSIHLTLCQKPWWCPAWIEEPQCSRFHYEWHRIRQDLEVTLGLQDSRYMQLDTIDTSDMRQVLGHFPKHCSRPGSKGYHPIQFELAWSEQEGQGEAPPLWAQ
jgi:hypothetical protein